MNSLLFYSNLDFLKVSKFLQSFLLDAAFHPKHSVSHPHLVSLYKY